MWIEKLARGVLELDTAIGPRYLQPNFLQRLSLMWTFRNFFSLPQQVLRPSEARLVDRLCLENRFIPLASGAEDRPIIGCIERRPANLAPVAANVLPMRKPVASAPSAVPDQSGAGVLLPRVANQRANRV
jgi:hypothetical protein